MTIAGEPIDIRDDPEQELRYELRRGDTVADADLEAMGELLQRSFGEWPAQSLSVSVEEHLRWKVDGAPGCPGWVQLVRHGDRVVAQHISLPVTSMVRGERVNSVLGCDSAVAPDFQGMGINRVRMAQLREVVDRDVELGFAFSGNPITIRHDSQYGRQELANPIVRVLLPLDARRTADLVHARFGRVPRRVLQGALIASRLLTRIRFRDRTMRDGDSRVVSVDRFDERFDELASVALERFQLAGRRDSSFLNWRFADPRAGRYRVRAVEEGGQVLGFVVTAPFEGRLRIVDLLVLPDRDDVLTALLQDVIAEARQTGAYAVESWCIARHPYRRLMSRLGFLPMRSDPGFSFRVTDPRPLFEGIGEPDAAIHLTSGDCDFI